MTDLPSRFQIGDSVRIGRQRGLVQSVSFEPGKIQYTVETPMGLIGPVPSEDVAPITDLSVITGGRA